MLLCELLRYEFQNGGYKERTCTSANFCVTLLLGELIFRTFVCSGLYITCNRPGLH